ncbi:hypothetical protein NADE_009137 [Nannochloris sp. 'desiccata']|nr:hypothetical protein KSW81_006095 [Chlorella desiccata (nom. nud.)]KAH7621084.1 hypothetical protein NADE_009137 [Chlorella desiccata (nom. nud.)]
MSTNTQGTAAELENQQPSTDAAGQNIANQVRLIKQVSESIRSGGLFDGEKTTTKGFILRADREFWGTAGEFLTPKQQAEAVTGAFHDTIIEAWAEATRRDPTIRDSWDNLKAWIQLHYSDPEDPRCQAARTLKTLRFTKGALTQQLREFEEALRELKITAPMSNYFFLACMPDAACTVLNSMHGRDYSNMSLTELQSKALPLIESYQPPSQPKTDNRPPSKGHKSSNDTGQYKPGGKVADKTEFAVLLNSLAAAPLPEGGFYKPKDVAALKANCSDAAVNPDAAKLKSFLNHHRLCYVCRAPGHSSTGCPAKGAARK